jgi:1-acyl-sn-glycerol-3-phosphate acyltransferase
MWYRLCYSAAWAAFTVAFSLRTVGSRHIPRRGPALLVANHESFLDPILVGLAARRPLRYLARKTLFRGLFGKVIQSLGAVPVDHRGFAREGLQESIQILQNGEPLVMFPEGERSHDGKLHEFKPGPMLVLKRAPAPVVPVGIAGAYESFPRTRKIPLASPLFWPGREGSLAVSIGRPIPPSRWQGMEREEAMALFREAVREQVGAAQRIRKR